MTNEEKIAVGAGLVLVAWLALSLCLPFSQPLALLQAPGHRASPAPWLRLAAWSAVS